MTFTLSDRARRAGYRLAAYDTIGSTSVEAMARAAAGERGPLWVVSAHQSRGRGRRGSVWESPRGNLAASLLARLELPPATLATLGFVAGLALARALERCCEPTLASCEGPRLHGSVPSGAHLPSRQGGGQGATPFSLKWPNDVLAGGAKLAGILLQTEELDGGRVVVIGIGVNVVAAPAGLPYPAACLRGLGCETDAESVFAALSESWVDAYELWSHGRGFGGIREQWLARASGLGGAVAVKTGSSITRGLFETIDEHGQLVLRRYDGHIERVSAGEVHFGPAGTVPTEVRA